MGCIFIPVVVLLLAITNVVIVRLFLRRHAGSGWWIVISCGWLVRLAVGVWGGFFFEYQASPRLRVFGAPVPAGFLHLEGPPGEEQWIDYVTPEPLLFAGSNIVIMAMLTSCPIGLVFWIWHWWDR